MITNTSSTTIKTSTVFSLPIRKIPGLPLPDSAVHILSDTTIQKPQEIVSGLLHQGTKGVIASGSKVGKTWLLLDLALSVATGTKFLRWGTTQGKVLFINFEIQTAFIKDRLTAIMNKRGIDEVNDLVFWNLRGKTADFEALVTHIVREVEGKGYSLIILDPIYKAMVGRSENVGSGVGVLCNQLERLAEKSGAAIVFAHHFAKGNAKKKAAIDRMSGSGVFARDADTIITLTEHTAPNCYTVEMILRNLPQQPSFVVQFDYPVMVEREDLDPEDVVMDDEIIDTDEGLMELLKDRPLTSGEWQIEAFELGVSRATFYRVKAKLREDGFVQFNIESKTWTLVNQAEVVSRETGETETASSVVLDV
jgi:hypothetical protein